MQSDVQKYLSDFSHNALLKDNQQFKPTRKTGELRVTSTDIRLAGGWLIIKSYFSLY